MTWLQIHQINKFLIIRFLSAKRRLPSIPSPFPTRMHPTLHLIHRLAVISVNDNYQRHHYLSHSTRAISRNMQSYLVQIPSPSRRRTVNLPVQQYLAFRISLSLWKPESFRAQEVPSGRLSFINGHWQLTDDDVYYLLVGVFCLKAPCIWNTYSELLGGRRRKTPDRLRSSGQILFY